jgi:hypothetical protein
MSQGTESRHISHKEKNIAYHIEWGFRREAAVWIGGNPARPNFHPLATELKNWLLRKGNLRVFSTKDRWLARSYTNPYAYNASVLAFAYATVVNDSADFSESTEALDSLDAEIKRIRLYTENVLYTARLCGALIKQLLYCTSFPEKYYRGVALRSLLSKDCKGCRDSNEKPHDISLLGSLAHRYRLCHAFEYCLNDHLEVVNRRRDLEAAHSGISKFSRRSTLAIRKDFGTEFIKNGKIFVHMLEHISEIEDKMVSELNSMIPAGIRSRLV